MTALLVLGASLICVASLLLVLALLHNGAEADEARADAQAVAQLAAERARNEMAERVHRLIKDGRR